ncbi:MAG: Uncharacterised protein [SAR116 cluster bacterium MED-G04]|nr:MAG: Uncharacterised protein [SAR116 cluster bacterium MED-G04]
MVECICTVRLSPLAFGASVSMARSANRAAASIECTRPEPSQCGQMRVTVSARLERRRWRDISSSPNWLMLPIWIRARSDLTASFTLRSTAFWLRLLSMSMKSMTISPDKSRRRS